jgi:hypothetical protein
MDRPIIPSLPPFPASDARTSEIDVIARMMDRQLDADFLAEIDAALAVGRQDDEATKVA